MRRELGRRLGALLCAGVMTAAMVPAGLAAQAADEFSDVRPGDWYYDMVTEMTGKGVVSGYPDGTFGPDREITRLEVAAMALKAFPDGAAVNFWFDPEQALKELEETDPGFWGSQIICDAVSRGITLFGTDRGEWTQPVTREELAYLLVQLYASTQPEGLEAFEEAAYLIGDYAGQVANSEMKVYILWLYTEGVISGMNSRGDFQPKDRSTRAQACTMLRAMLHPESWVEHDWEQVVQDYQRREQELSSQVTTGTDFKGQTRTRYGADVAYDFCRALEEEIGIQIFYLPEWTEKEAGMFGHDRFDSITLDSQYFQLVLGELQKMKAAYDLYPDGFLREMAERKGSRKAEIILCPYTYMGMGYSGVHVYDYSDDAQKVDQIYYTGIGDSQYYSHEMGHMALSCMAILNGWNATCQQWESYSGGPEDFVSSYAMSSRPEDWAETWAYLWHQTDYVRGLVNGGASGLGSKVKLLTQLMGQYRSVDVNSLPWADLA